jgi:hypothetical protein
MRLRSPLCASPSNGSRTLAIVVAGAVGAACASDGSSGSDVKSAYPEWNAATINDYLRAETGGASVKYTSHVVGQKTVGAATYDRLRIEKATGAGVESAEVWITKTSATRLTVAGGAYDSTLAAGLGLPASASATLTAPLVVDLEPPAGTPQAFTVAGSFTAGTGAAQSLSVTGSYTLVETGVAVSTAMGAVGGASHYRFTARIPIFAAVTIDTGGDAWYTDAYGLVKATLDPPLSSLTFGFLGTRGSRDLPDGYASVEGVATLGGGVAGSFQVSSYDVAHAFDADKNSHAKMLLEVRWLDDAKARTESQPPVTETFATVIGVFPSTFARSSLSFLHPEENGKGFVYWIAFVDQAAKNEAQNGIAYQVSARYDVSASPVRAAARVVYKRVSP